MDYIKWLGLAAAFFITVANMPQTIKLVRTRSAKDISTMTYVLLVIGNATWLTYGILKSDVPLIVGNSISSVLCATILGIKIFSNREDDKQQ